MLFPLYCFRATRVTAFTSHRILSFSRSKMAHAGEKHKRSNSDEVDNIYDDPDHNLYHPTPKRGKEIDQNRPYDELETLLEKNKSGHQPRNVLHWFRFKDIRQEDNKALHAASKKAKEGSGSLITMYLHSPKDIETHGTSPARLDFILDSFRILQEQLSEKNIPLAMVEVSTRKDKADKVMKFVKDNNVSHIYANMEYEVDELRRDINIAKQVQEQKDLSFELLHDETVVTPGALTTGSGGPIQVFTPYHKAWLPETKKNKSLLETAPPPEANDYKASQEFEHLFESSIPEIPESKRFASQEERDRLRKLWPAGNEAGMKRLEHFLNNKV